MTETQGTLLGPRRPPASDLEQAVETTISAKRDAGLLGPEHAALVQLARDLARAISAGAAYGKTSVPAAAQQLREVLADLPVPTITEDTAEASLAALMRGDAPTEDPA